MFSHMSIPFYIPINIHNGSNKHWASGNYENVNHLKALESVLTAYRKWRNG